MELDISVMAGVRPKDCQLAVDLDTSSLRLDPLIGQQGVGMSQKCCFRRVCEGLPNGMNLKPGKEVGVVPRIVFLSRGYLS